ncbi:Glycosyl hydrolase family protein isoform 4 [Hibiscus syriacus]|uniref:Glycosyl hydrolase family protein isoform 4 n=1 Tax=Hibiscus syriacus TaxID=106335 RepID=A0A6A3CG06_HIBSY|nr:Glycosyl hydrolase family protein isoform 4 [Hibiscus syriacus]
MVDGFQQAALQSRLGIPLIYGVDAVHGNNNVYGATIFPHNVGLRATRDADLAQRIGVATALEVRTSGVHLPLLCVCGCNRVSNCNRGRDCVFGHFVYTAIGAIAVAITAVAGVIAGVMVYPRWGRCYESYSENTDIVRKTTSIITGLQGKPPVDHPKGYSFVAGRNNVISCAKHFVGDGGTEKGVNEGNTVSSFDDLESTHVAPYLDCISQGVSAVMASYSTIDKLTEPQGSNYRYCISAAVSAGLDMVMVPRRYKQFIEDLTFLVESGEVPLSGIDDCYS